MLNQLNVVDPQQSDRNCCRIRPLGVGVLLGISMAFIGVTGFVAGSYFRAPMAQNEGSTDWNGIPVNQVPPELLKATATHGGTNLAIATGQIDNDSEGFFALDYLTGDLKCWVYNPRAGGFGAMFYTNVQGQLGMSKNPEYLIVTGGAVSSAVGGNVRPAASIVYVVDTKSGFFAAYTVPWNKAMENSGSVQGGAMIAVGGGQVREPQMGARKPANPPGGAGANAPGKPGAPAGRPAPGGAKPPAGGAAAPGAPAGDAADAANPFGLQNPLNPNAPANPRKPQ